MLATLGGDALGSVVIFVPRDDLLPAALSCKPLATVCKARADREREKDGPRWITAATSRLARMKWAVLDMQAFIPQSWCAALARRGDKRLLCYMLSDIEWESPDLSQDETVCAAAAAAGHVGLLEWLHFEKAAAWDNITVLQEAAAGGHLTVLRRLCPFILQREFASVEDSQRAIQAMASSHGHLHILQWMHGQMDGEGPPTPWGVLCCALAAANGQIAVLQWLRSLQPLPCPWGEFVCMRAAAGGHLATLQWLRSQGCPWDMERCMCGAAESGCLTMLQWMRSQGCPWSEPISERAARGGHLAILQWLRSQGCPWNASACMGAAAESGCLTMLQWLRSQGCPWDASACMGAAHKGHLTILQWLRSQGCPWDASACLVAVQHGHLATLQWLHSQGCPWHGDECSSAALNGGLVMLKWLRSPERNPPCPWNKAQCIAEAENWNRTAVVEWIRAQP